jgi:hypothetical protein
LLSTFATAIVLGVLIDNHRSPRLSRTQQRLLEAVAQGLIMAGVAYVTRLWLMERAEHAASFLTNYRVPDLQRVMVTAGMIGCVLGFCIPTWFREAPRARLETKEVEGGLELAASDAAVEPSI